MSEDATSRLNSLGLISTRRIPDLLRCCGSIEINECHQLFRQVGEQLEFSGIQRLAQQLKQEGVPAVSKGL
jgi:hypothetical protein